MYFRSIVDSPDCAAGVVGLDRLAADLRDPAGTPAFSYIVPDACHDGRDAPCEPGAPAGPAIADGWLRTVVEPILASRAYREGGLVVITGDQAPAAGPGADSSACCAVPVPYPNSPGAGGPLTAGAGGGRVGALLLSPYVRPGATVATAYNHFSLLRAIEDLFGLEPLGYAASKGVKRIGKGVFANSEAQDVHTPATSP